MNLGDPGRPLYEPHRETWTRWASLTAVLLALVAALAAGAAAHWGVKAYRCFGQAQQYRAEHQALSKTAVAWQQSRDFFTLHRLLEHKNAKVHKFIEGKLKDAEEELARLASQGEQSKAAAEVQEHQGERLARQAAGAARTVWVLFLAVILAAVSVPSKKKLLWLTALVLALGGAASFLSGAFLWF